VRGQDQSDSQTSDQILSTLLIEMDGISNYNSRVIILAATNRIDMIDPAILRPGRFDQKIKIDLPDQNQRYEILKKKIEKIPVEKNLREENKEDSYLFKLSKKTEGFSGSELDNLIRESCMESLRENINSIVVEKKHFKKSKKIIQFLKNK
jgi:transitional endoplasmic reticulum ATPase